MEQYAGLLGVPIVFGLVHVAKAWVTDSRWYPVMAMGLGVFWNVALAIVMHTSLGDAGIMGIVVGLAASGLYDVGTRTVLNR